MTGSKDSEGSSALELAALASAAVPGLQALGVKDYISTDTSRVVTVVDDHGDDWQVWSLQKGLSKENLETLLRTLRLLDGYFHAKRLPFRVPEPSGIIDQKAGGTTVVYRHMGGSPGRETYLAGSGVLATSIGGVLGHLHSLPIDGFVEVTQKLTTPDERRSELVNLVKRHSTAIPTDLRNRWMGALKDSALWQVDPVPTHGSLAVSDFQVASGGAVLGIRGFDRASVDDPAIDLTWLMYHGDDEFLSGFEEAYARVMSAKDLHILTRAQLYAEIETLKWYDQAVEADDSACRKAGAASLRDMAEELAGELLVAPKDEVVEIQFTADEEPLLKVNPHLRKNPDTGATVASLEVEE